jgi:polyribonucleotide nucleotidyltransferase
LAPLNGGKRIGQVEDVLELGQALEVKVDDIDPQGKVSLSLVGDFPDVVEEPRRERSDRSDRPSRERSERPERESRDRSDRPERSERPAASNASSSSFEASFEAELAGEIGDLGPGGPTFSDGDGGGRRSPRPRRR